MAEGGPKVRQHRDAARLLLHPKRLWREHRRWAIGLIAAAILAITGIAVAYSLLEAIPASAESERIQTSPVPNGRDQIQAMR
jgi:hypothetical protein